jgi:hypothetical protein
MNLKTKTDEELCMIAQEGGPGCEAEGMLVARYWDLTAILANAFPIRGIEHDDRQMAAMQGLLGAVRKYRPDRGTKFKTFAKLRMRNSLTDLHRDASQAGEIPVRLMRSLDAVLGTDEDATLQDILPAAGDVQGEILTRGAVLAATDRLMAGQLSALLDHAGGEDGGEIVAEAVRRWAYHALSPDQYREFVGVMGAMRQAQMTMAHALLGPEGVDDLLLIVFTRFAQFQVAILRDLAAGYQYREIAQRQTFALGWLVRPELVSGAIKPLQTLAGITDAASAMAA